MEDPIAEVGVLGEETDSSSDDLKELRSNTQESKWQKKKNVILMLKRKRTDVGYELHEDGQLRCWTNWRLKYYKLSRR